MHRTSLLTKCFKCTVLSLFVLLIVMPYPTFFPFLEIMFCLFTFYFVGSFLLCLFGWLVDCDSESSSLFLLLSPIVSQSS